MQVGSFGTSILHTPNHSSLSLYLDSSRCKYLFLATDACLLMLVDLQERRLLSGAQVNCACVAVWTHPQFDEISMVTLCLPFHFAHTINNCTLSLQHQRSFLNYIGVYTYTHTRIYTLAVCMDMHPNTSWLPASGNLLIDLNKMDRLNLNMFFSLWIRPCLLFLLHQKLLLCYIFDSN